MSAEFEILKVINKYIEARKQFLEFSDKYPNLIGGNDNIIGRIGEFYTMAYLATIGQRPKKVNNASNPGYDLIDEITSIKTQVKVITCENKNKRTVRLTEPWDQFILILLNENYKINKLGLIKKTEFHIALANENKLSKNPVVKASMLNPAGLIFRYGKVINDINIYELIYQNF